MVGDGLGFFADASETEALINKDWNSNGVLFIPALSGLGVPHWNPTIKGSFYGLTADNNKAVSYTHLTLPTNSRV